MKRDFAGSPPHTRDKFFRELKGQPQFRIIPAYAGQISRLKTLWSLFQDHPRIRGTNRVIGRISSFPKGSSPHTRDKYDAWRR